MTGAPAIPDNISGIPQAAKCREDSAAGYVRKRVPLVRGLG